MNIMKLFSVSCLVFMLSACASQTNSNGIQLDPTLHTQSKGDYESDVWHHAKREVALPQNYSQKNYKRIVLAANFFANEDYNTYGSTPIEVLSTMLETEMSKLKRFTLVSRHLGQKGKWAEKKFQDMGTTSARSTMRIGNGLNADFGLTGGISSIKEEYDRGSRNEVIYIVRIDYQITDFETDEIIEADMAEGRAKRSIFRLPSGKVVGGFSDTDESEAVKQAAINALKVVANKLGNKLPIGCQVTGIRGNRFGCDRGYEEGFMGKQMVTIYMDDNGIDLPLAVAEASPGAHKTSGKIIAWNNDEDEYVQDMIRQIRANPRFARQNDLFAVSLAMPTPPEWDSNYKD